MSTYIFAHNRTEKKGKRIVLKPNFFVGKVSLMFMLTVFIGVLGVVYLVSFNDSSILGYEVTKLEYEREEILSMRDQENVSISTSQSRDFILNSDKVQGMVPVREIYYVGTGTVVAYK